MALSNSCHFFDSHLISFSFLVSAREKLTPVVGYSKITASPYLLLIIKLGVYSGFAIPDRVQSQALLLLIFTAGLLTTHR